MDYGLTEKGFIAKPLGVILEEERAAYRKAFGNDIDLSQDSPDGAYIGNQAVKLAQLWELLEGLWAAGDRDSASGVYLDRLAALVNVYRQPAVSTAVYTALWGEPGTLIPAGHLAKLAGGEPFRLTTPVTIGFGSLLGFSFKAGKVQSGADYSFQINGSLITYTAGAGDTEETIPAGLYTQLTVLFPGIYEAEHQGKDGIGIHPGEGIKPFALVFDDPKLELVALGAFGVYEAETAGPLFVPSKTLTKIVANVDGLERLINYAPGITGRYGESDSELRINLENRQKQASGNEIALENEIKKLNGVQYAKVYSNRSAVEFQGRPPKSYEAIVLGGNEYEIAQTLFDRGPAGVQAFGNRIITVLDAEGFPWEIGFSRPVNRYIWITIDIVKYSAEGFPMNGLSQIKEALETWGTKNLGVGADLLYQRMTVPIFQVPGIALAEIRVADTLDLTPPAAGKYQAVNISLGEREIALIDQSRIILRETPR